jgi:hypothetical protein
MKEQRVLAKAAAAAHDLAEALAELAKQSEPSGERHADCYDSTHLPARTSRRRFAECCRSGRVSGAYRDGRYWVCSREAWHSARGREDPTRRPAPPTSNPSLEERAEKLLQRSGFRLIPARAVSPSRGPE